MKNDSVKVTDLELRILQQIWSKENSATVQAILDDWTEGDRPGYTTVLKTLQKMEKKKIVAHVQDGKKYFYSSKISKDHITRTRLGTLIERVFSGDKISFAEHFLKSNHFSSKELSDLKELIASKEKEGK